MKALYFLAILATTLPTAHAGWFDQLSSFSFKSCDSKTTVMLESKYESIRQGSAHNDLTFDLIFFEKLVSDFCPEKTLGEWKRDTVKYRQMGISAGIRKLKASVFEKAQRGEDVTALVAEMESKIKNLQQLGVNTEQGEFSEAMMNEVRQRAQQGIVERSKKNKERYEHNAKYCTAIDNRRPPLIDGKKQDVMRDQDSVGWCYAYAAADLVSHKMGKTVSAIDMANSYIEKEKADQRVSRHLNEIEGGWVAKTIELSLAKGLCLEADLPSSQFIFSDNKSSLLINMNALNDFYKSFKKNPTSWSKVLNDKSCQTCKSTLAAFQNLFPTLTFQDLALILESTANSQDLLHNLIEKSCKKRIPNTRALKVVQQMNQSPMDNIATLDRVLLKGDIAAITYNYAEIERKTDMPLGKSSQHASTIVGRRFNPLTGSCDYLLRNTWGRTCPLANSEIDCKNGNMWIPMDKMMKMVRAVDYVE